jgi:protein gp37
MGEDTKIEWATHTFNPWIGCQKVGPGCDHCYAEAMMADRYKRVEWGPHGARSRTSGLYWQQPLQWNRAAAKAGKRARVFCASLADVFDNHGSITSGWRGDLWHLISRTPNLDWLLLTKRPGNIPDMLPDGYGAPAWGDGWPNVWLGCTVVNQAEADRDIPKLLAVPAKVRFLSMEPLLGPVNLLITDQRGHDINVLRGIGCDPTGEGPDEYYRTEKINWIICGGESGKDARPMHPDWARSLRDQSQAAGVAFHFKQWGEWGTGSQRMTTGEPVFRVFTDFQHWVNKASTWVRGGICLDARGRLCKIGADMMRARDELAFPVTIMDRVGKARAGRLLDGREWNELPGVHHG